VYTLHILQNHEPAPRDHHFHSLHFTQMSNYSYRSRG